MFTPGAGKGEYTKTSFAPKEKKCPVNEFFFAQYSNTYNLTFFDHHDLFKLVRYGKFLFFFSLFST